MNPPTSSQRAVRAFIGVCVLVVGGFLALGAYLSYDTLSTNGREMVRSRFELSAQRVVLTAQRAMSTGLELSTQTTLTALLQRAREQDPEIHTFDVLDARGRVMFSADPARSGSAATATGDSVIDQELKDDLDKVQGRVQIQFDGKLLTDLNRRLSEDIWKQWLIVSVVACFFTVVAGVLLNRFAMAIQSASANGQNLRGTAVLRPGFRTSISFFSGSILFLALAALNWQIDQIAEQTLSPQMLIKARSVARASSTQIEFAIQTGVPLSGLRGVEQHFDGLLKSGAEITRMELRSSSGKNLVARGESKDGDTSPAVSEPVVVDGQELASVRVRVNERALESRLRAAAVDTGFLAVVVLLMANELMALLGTISLSQHLIHLDRALIRILQPAGPLTGASGTATSVRPVLFIFMMAEEVTRPFLPSYARAMVPQGLGHGAGWGSLPLVIFLVTVALCQLPFASLSVRLGRRNGLMWGAVVAAVGYALCGWSEGFWMFNVARFISALGFAMVFVSSQGAVVDGSDAGNRAESVAMFVRAILVAGLCGPPLGGLLADRWGVPVVFGVSAAMCLIALMLARGSLPGARPSEMAPFETGFAGLPVVLQSSQLRGLILGCAMPAKLMLAATCFYLVPFGLAQDGYSSSEVGRFLMIYPLIMVIGVTPLAAWSNRLKRERDFVVWGGLLAGAGGLLALSQINDWTVITLLALLGIGQAMSITAQTNAVVRIAHGLPSSSSSQALGVFRLLERGGSAMGPAVGALLLASFGLGPAIAATGMVVIAGNLAYQWQMRADGPLNQGSQHG